MAAPACSDSFGMSHYLTYLMVMAYQSIVSGDIGQENCLCFNLFGWKSWSTLLWRHGQRIYNLRRRRFFCQICIFSTPSVTTRIPISADQSIKFNALPGFSPYWRHIKARNAVFTHSHHPPRRLLSVRLQTHPGNFFIYPHIAGVLVVAADVDVYGGQVELSSSRSVGVWGQWPSQSFCLHYFDAVR